MDTTNQRKPKIRFFTFTLLFVVWILLTNSLTIGNILLALFLSASIVWLVRDIRSNTIRLHKPLSIPKYVLILFWDIVSSNFIVAKQVLGPIKKLKPGFVAVPLDMREPIPITLLASTVSLTPGTVSTEVSEDFSILYVHALNVSDEQALINEIKQRYEKPLKEIFGC
ncbi:Na+/H+ antiporter subunit E [Reinekea thalattae]|uniref:Na+/H+ antiporter subunit E n=1 Tax=Reinekea thalattae TaxID=2593301 RepID=A0A5C8ZCH8_9GAMM|nr:Na+/H+ antiporter subunit E [Reinekea thalattae]TXR54550.1 Na+/H+ antiporter subunit E [Reinekea thalattae]